MDWLEDGGSTAEEWELYAAEEDADYVAYLASLVHSYEQCSGGMCPDASCYALSE